VACELHKSHTPTNLSVETHHIIPRGLAAALAAAKAMPFPGPDTEGRGELWDCRTVQCCPTGHRNTHVWIVRLMHALKSAEVDEAVEQIRSRVTRAHRSGALGQQYAYAEQALARFKEAGGSLAELVAAHQWGQS
jgi:hypothetical protein